MVAIKILKTDVVFPQFLLRIQKNINAIWFLEENSNNGK